MKLDYTDTQRTRKKRRHHCKVCDEPIAHPGPVSVWPSYKLRGFCTNACRMTTVQRRKPVQTIPKGGAITFSDEALAFITGAYWTPGARPDVAGFMR